jgi:hypothetical protein
MARILEIILSRQAGKMKPCGQFACQPKTVIKIDESTLSLFPFGNHEPLQSFSLSAEGPD